MIDPTPILRVIARRHHLAESMALPALQDAYRAGAETRRTMPARPRAGRPAYGDLPGEPEIVARIVEEGTVKARKIRDIAADLNRDGLLRRKQLPWTPLAVSRVLSAAMRR